MAEMGKLLAIPQTTYSNYEHGVREIPNKCMNRVENKKVNVCPVCKAKLYDRDIDLQEAEQFEKLMG